MTGFFRTVFCDSCAEDGGQHSVCAQTRAKFLHRQLEFFDTAYSLLSMARSSSHLIDTLRHVAGNLESGADYNWGNATKCNCAHLVQCLEPETAPAVLKEIRPQLDEWTEFANDYCPHSGASTDQLLDTLYEHGLTHDDIHQLEYLSNQRVLQALPGGFRYLEHGNRRHVALYMRTWASLLELDSRESSLEQKTRVSLSPSSLS